MIRQLSSILLALAVLLLASTSRIHAAEIERYDEGPFAGMGYPFSESARVGDLLFLAGQTGEDADGNLVKGGIKAEAEQALLNIEAALVRRGLAMEHVVKCTVFLADIAEWATFNEVYTKRVRVVWPEALESSWSVSPDILTKNPDQSSRYGSLAALWIKSS
jgi:enamine deaminase RidA (YjgF/YER057c/UK114 family)